MPSAVMAASPLSGTWTALFAFGVLTAAGCDKPAAPLEPEFSDAVTDAGSGAQPSNQYSQELFAMHPQARRAMFRKLMRESGEACDLVTEAVLRGGHEGTDLWRVACTDTGDWMISIKPDSSTKILSCAITATLGDECRAVWRENTSPTKMPTE